MEVVSTLKIYKIVALVKISLGGGFQLVTSATVHGTGIIFHIYFQVGRELDGIFCIVFCYDTGNVLTSIYSVDS